MSRLLEQRAWSSSPKEKHAYASFEYDRSFTSLLGGKKPRLVLRKDQELYGLSLESCCCITSLGINKKEQRKLTSLRTLKLSLNARLEKVNWGIMTNLKQLYFRPLHRSSVEFHPPPSLTTLIAAEVNCVSFPRSLEILSVELHQREFPSDLYQCTSMRSMYLRMGLEFEGENIDLNRFPLLKALSFDYYGTKRNIFLLRKDHPSIKQFILDWMCVKYLPGYIPLHLPNLEHFHVDLIHDHPLLFMREASDPPAPPSHKPSLLEIAARAVLLLVKE